MSKKFPINGIPGYSDNRLYLKVSRLWFIPSKLYLDNKPLKREKGSYLLGVNKEIIKLKFRKIGFDPIPKLSINDSKYNPALSIPLSVTEQIWCMMPFLILFNSYTIGAFIISSFFSLINLWFFHSKKNIVLKYFITGINIFINCFFTLLIQHILK